MKLRNSKIKNIIKAVNNFQPFDYGYLLEIEKQALINMREYFKISDIAVGNDINSEKIGLAIKLLDIILEKDMSVNINFLGDKVSISSIKYVNIKNAKRFIVEWKPEFDTDTVRDYLRQQKALYLYHKLRYYYINQWWD